MKLRFSILTLIVLLVAAGLTCRVSSPQPVPHNALTTGTSTPQPRLAPLNTAFVKYIRLHQATRGQKADGLAGPRSSSLAPSPIDFSYLRDAKVQLDTATYPASYDLRKRGKLGPVKNQGHWGACWAFAALGSLESRLLPSYHATFSEDNLVLGSGFSFANPYEVGGTSLMATAYLARWAGPISASEDAYGDSYTPAGLTAERHVQEVLYLPPRGRPKDHAAAVIKWAVKKYGAVYASLYADSGMTGSHDSSAYNAATASYCYIGAKNANHAVDIVGWDDKYSAANFSTKPDGNGAFIVRNSWGPKWGDGGYFYVSYYDTRIAVLGSPQGGENDLNAVFDDVEPAGNFSGIYQYDPLGWTSAVGYPTGSTPDTAWFANSFIAESSDELAAVSFYTAELSSSYTVYVSASSLPSSTMTPCSSGSFSMPGYHTVTLASPVPLTSGQNFTVAVKLTTPGYDYPIPLETRIDGYTSGATSAPGESFVSPNGIDWTDLTTLPPNGQTYYSSANVCLKAFTRAPGIPDSKCPAWKKVRSAATRSSPLRSCARPWTPRPICISSSEPMPSPRSVPGFAGRTCCAP